MLNTLASWAGMGFGDNLKVSRYSSSKQAWEVFTGKAKGTVHGDLKLVTFNVWFDRFDRPRRCEALLDLLSSLKPHFVGLQEGYPNPFYVPRTLLCLPRSSLLPICPHFRFFLLQSYPVLSWTNDGTPRDKRTFLRLHFPRHTHGRLRHSAAFVTSF